jgi:hypothetical protein
MPGPLGIASWADGGISGHAVGSSTLASERALAESASVTFTLGSEIYRLRRLGDERSLDFDEYPVPPEEAQRIIDTALGVHSDDLALVSRLNIGISQLTGLEEGGTFILMRLRRRRVPSGGGTAPATYTPPPARRPTPASPPPPSVDPSLSLEVAAAQAATLKTAAESGVPFCEVCAREAAEKGVSSGQAAETSDVAARDAADLSGRLVFSDAPPSQPRPRPPVHWIEIELVGEDDLPIEHEAYVLVLPDGTEVRGSLDANGWARVPDVSQSGTCKLTFPRLDRDAWTFVRKGPARQGAAG